MRSEGSEASSRGAASPGPVIGVLALQGSFSLHRRALERCGVSSREVRVSSDLEGIAGLVLPGGESTTMARLAGESGLMVAIRARGRAGLPMFGTCAGAVLLGRGEELPPRLELVDVEVKRNAYGRQVDSFTAELDLEPLDGSFHGIFIRAPHLHPRRPGPVEVLGRHEGLAVLVRQGSCLLASFHPELTDDTRVHQLFLRRCCAIRPPPDEPENGAERR